MQIVRPGQIRELRFQTGQPAKAFLTEVEGDVRAEEIEGIA